MSKQVKYTKSHEWVSVDGSGLATVGISDYAQGALGDVVFVDLPAVGTVAKATGEIAVVESVKAASDIYSPVSGEVVEVNTALQGSPDLINSSPLGEGWLYRLKLSDPAELDGLLDETAYAAICA
ncbi:MAG: glycine cleavage system protein GcvH [Pseudohongiellaceae bacterium]